MRSLKAVLATLVASANNGLMNLVAGMNVIRFTPSLVIPFEDIKEGLARFEKQ